MQNYLGAQTESNIAGNVVNHSLDHPQLDLDTATTYNDSFQGKQPGAELPSHRIRARKQLVNEEKQDNEHVTNIAPPPPTSLTRYPHCNNPHKCAPSFDHIPRWQSRLRIFPRLRCRVEEASAMPQ